MTDRCAVAALLTSSGPVRVSMRPCCVLALVGGRPPTDPDLREAFICAGQKDLQPVGVESGPEATP